MSEEIIMTKDNCKVLWGFRLTEGRDFGSPLTVARITGKSIAESRGLRVGDIITEISNEKTIHLTHGEAQQCITDAGTFLKLIVLRGSSPVIPPAITPVRGINNVEGITGDDGAENTDESNQDTSIETDNETVLNEIEQDIEEENDGESMRTADGSEIEEGTREEIENEDVKESVHAKQVEKDNCEHKEENNVKRRPGCPLTLLPRPVVLPGGRIWRKPKDAYNEEFIAETLISQVEVLVCSTLGVNFRKYEPPKFDLSNSAVYKFVHNIESQKAGLGDRDVVPSLQDYYQSPISARHFYCASLANKPKQATEDTNADS